MAHRKKLKKMYIHLAGQTMDAHRKLIKRLKRKGARSVRDPNACDVTILFCPIVSRFETDVESALTSLKVQTKESPLKNVIVVAMHHTHNPDMTFPIYRDINNEAVILLVDCLFHEARGMLDCQQNKNAFREVRRKMGFRRRINFL